MKGRFYSKDPYFGPPHASSTGVYLEGLIDAYSLAKAVVDRGRVATYRRAILEGLRSLRELQFKNDIDSFYISDKKKVMGALRTNVYNNTIRVDNVQHGLLALQKILDIFDSTDFRAAKDY